MLQVLGPILIRPVKLLSYSTGIVSQQGNLGMNKPWLSFCSYHRTNMFHHFERSFKIATINLDSTHSFEACRKLKGIHCPRFLGSCTDTPIIVLNKVDNRNLL